MKRIFSKSSAATIKAMADHVLVQYRQLTGPVRILPDFIIIGAQKCGTTALYTTLIQHPAIAPALKKEVHFFDINFRQGPSWYRAHFPLYVQRLSQQVRGQPSLTGEASPYYLFHPCVPERVSELLPTVQLICLLRNPVDRAYSHYQHEVRKGFETLSFEDAVEKEMERLAHGTPWACVDNEFFSFNHRHYSYLARGIYVNQLRLWRRFFSENQILILKAEDYYANAQSAVNTVLDFLELPRYPISKAIKSNRQTYPRMEHSLRKSLLGYFEPHNRELYRYLGANFGWET